MPHTHTHSLGGRPVCLLKKLSQWLILLWKAWAPAIPDISTADLNRNVYYHWLLVRWREFFFLVSFIYTSCTEIAVPSLSLSRCVWVSRNLYLCHTLSVCCACECMYLLKLLPLHCYFFPFDSCSSLLVSLLRSHSAYLPLQWNINYRKLHIVHNFLSNTPVNTQRNFGSDASLFLVETIHMYSYYMHMHICVFGIWIEFLSVSPSLSWAAAAAAVAFGLALQ